MAKNLFVGSLPFSVTDDTLGQLFSQHGQVVSVNVIKDRYTGASRGFAFVEMATDEDAKMVIEKLNNYNLEGRNIVVKEALPKPTYTNGRSGTQGGRGGSRFGGGGSGGRGGSRFGGGGSGGRDRSFNR
jgi:RNA recognition motif-containing protein